MAGQGRERDRPPGGADRGRRPAQDPDQRHESHQDRRRRPQQARQQHPRHHRRAGRNRCRRPLQLRAQQPPGTTKPLYPHVSTINSKIAAFFGIFTSYLDVRCHFPHHSVATQKKHFLEK